MSIEENKTARCNKLYYKKLTIYVDKNIAKKEGKFIY